MNCINFKNLEVAALLLEYTEILSGENAAYYVIAENNGYGLDKAPNGADSELFKALLDGLNGDRAEAIKEKAKVYSKSFRDWFGDWISGDKTNVSKVVDLNGEPLIVYHGSRDKFDTFDSASRTGKYHDSGQFGVGDYFTINKQAAASYGDNKNIYPVFLNIKTPFNGSIEDVSSSLGVIKSSTEFKETFKDSIKDQNLSEEDINKMLGNYDTTDGVIINSTTTDFDELVTFNSNQVKSALYNEGSFSTKDNNIYHSLGEINEDVISQVSQLATRHSNGVWTTEDSEDKINSIFETAKSNSYRVRLLNKWKSANIQPFVLQYVGKGFSEKTSKKDKEVIGTYLNYLKDVFPEINIEWVQQNEFFDKWVTEEHINAEANSFVKDGTIYLIEGRVTAEIAIEEFLHPLITSMLYDNTMAFNNLLKDALKNYKSLVKDIQKRYKGFSKEDIDNEIVTQTLTKIVKKRYDTLTKEERKIETLFLSWIITKFKEIGRKIAASFVNINKNIKLKDLAELITSEQVLIYLSDKSKKDIKYNLPGQLIYNIEHAYSIKHFNDLEEQLSYDMLKLFSKMYNKYNKVQKKTKSQQRILDKIYENYQDLKTKHDKESLRVGLMFAQDRLGSINQTREERKGTILGFFDDIIQPDGTFKGITDKQLFDLWDNALSYLQEIHKLIGDARLNHSNNHWSDKDLRDRSYDLLISIDLAITYWRSALLLVTDKIIDDLVDKWYTIDNTTQKEKVKENAKDWLHKNAVHSDISNISKWFSNYSYSENPVIKLAFLVIQEANYRANKQSIEILNDVMNLYKEAKPLGNSWRPGSWEKVFMEYDRLGNPTGNFVRPINYGLYNIDRCEFMDRLKEEFENKYGFFYYENDAGVVIRSGSQYPAENEEWEYDEEGKPVQPPYVEWLLKIEEWECKHANKRYTFEYYKERLSIPYDGSTDEYGNYNIYASKGHGLSLKTLTRYNRILSNINYYLDKCTDKNGFAKPEELEPSDKISLDSWKTKLEELSNPYTEEGELKSDEDVKCALEIQAWLNFIGEKTNKSIDRLKFDKEINRITAIALNEYIQSLNHPILPGSLEERNMLIHVNLKLQEFYKYNTRRQIDPDYFDQTFGRFTRYKEYSDDDSLKNEAIKASYFLSALKSSMHTYDAFTRDLSKFINNPLFFIDARNRDEIINRGVKTRNVSIEEGDSFFKMFTLKYKTSPTLYIEKEVGPDRVTRYILIDKLTGERYYSGDTSKTRIPMTAYEYVLKKYVEEALLTGFIHNLTDANGVPISFEGKTQTQIINWLDEHLFRYTREYYDENGNKQYEPDVLIGVFSLMEPSELEFISNDGTKRKTVDYIPIGSRFSESYGEYYNSEYDHSDPNGVLPKKEYYENKDYYKMAENNEQKALYDKLINVMKQSLAIVQPNSGQYQYFLPQIEGNTMSILSRCNLLNSKSRGKTWNYLMNAAFGMQQNDYEYIRLLSDVKNADGTNMYHVPIRFLRKLDDPSSITSHITEAVLAFADMANLFKEKTQVLPLLSLLLNALAPKNRELTVDRIYANNSVNSWEAFNNMMKTHMFERVNDTSESESLSAKKSKLNSVGALKMSTRIKTMLLLRMLGFNFTASITSGLDSFFKFFRQSLLMKYNGPRDFFAAIADVLNPYELTLIFRSCGTPVPTSKLVALMLLNSMKHSFRDRISMLNHGKLSHYVNPTNWLMDSFSAFDYVNTALVLRAFYNGSRLYTGPYAKPGFYTRHELVAAFKNSGFSGISARKAHLLCKKTMWDAYGFKNGKLYIKPEYEKYLTDDKATRIYTKTQLRSALYNGMQPENDTPYFQTQWWGKWIFSIRNWMLQTIQQWTTHGDDYTLYNVKEKENYKLKGNVFRKSIKYIAERVDDMLSDNPLFRKNISFNVATGEYNDLILYEVARFCLRILHNAYYLFTFLWKKLDIMNSVSRNAICKTIIDAAFLYGQIMACVEAHNSLKMETEAQPAPSGFVTSTGERSSNIIDFSPNTWIQNGEYRYTTNLLQTRLIGGTMDEMSPYAVYDLVKTAIAISSGAETFGQGAAGLMLNAAYAINPDLFSFAVDGSEIVKLGAYRGESILVKNLSYLISPFKSLHSTFSPNGSSLIDIFYQNLYKYLFTITGNHILKTEEAKQELKYIKHPGLRERYERILERKERMQERIQERKDRAEERRSRRNI